MLERLLAEEGVYTLRLNSVDDRYYYVEILAMKPGVNRNKWDFTLDGIKKNGKTFAGMPLLVAYKGDKIGDGHNFDYTYNRVTGEIEADFRGKDAERIVGEIPEDADIRVETINGEDWLILPARIWRYYAQQLTNYIKDNKVMDVSVEVEVAEGYEVREDGTEVFDEWTALGVTILGQGVTPAIEGARLRALAASDAYKTMRLKAASYVPEKKHNNGGIFMNEALKKMLSEAMKDYGTIVGFSADGKFASVLRTNGVPALYPLANFNEKDGVIQSLFVNATISFSASIEGEDGESAIVTCAADECLSAAEAEAEAAKQECEAAKTECEAAKEECAKANARVAELEKANADREMSETMAAFDNAVAKYNNAAASNEQITEEEINTIHNSIKEGKITCKEDAVGEFKKLAYDKKEASAKKQVKTFAWDNANGEEPLTGVDAVIAKFTN